MKRLLVAVALFSTHCLASTPSPSQVFDTITPTLQAHPEITEIEICVETRCETFSDLVWERKGGKADLVYKAKPNGGNEGGGNPAEAIGEIVGSVGKHMGAGGRLTVDYETSTEADGSSKTKVHVEISVGVGTAAAPAASN